MKFLDETDIELINQFLTFDTLDVHITGGCDLFTTKPVGADRKLYKTIDKQFDALIESTASYNNNQHNLQNHHIDDTNHLINNEFLETKRRFSTNSDTGVLIDSSTTSNSNLQELSNSYGDHHSHDTPFGPLEQTTSRRTFAYLIGILNSSYPDHDFSSLQPSNFLKISQHVLKSKFENTLISLGKSNFQFIWDIIDQQIELKFSTFYELSIDEVFEDEEQNGSAGSLWQYKWFIFNKKKKRVAFLYLNGFRLQSPKLYPVQPQRRLTIDNDLDNEEYDLTYPSDENLNSFEDVFEEDEDDYKISNHNVQLEISQ